MRFQEAVEFTHKFREYFQSKDTFLVISIPGSVYYSGVLIYNDSSVRVIKLDDSNGQAIDSLTLKSLVHRIV